VLCDPSCTRTPWSVRYAHTVRRYARTSMRVCAAMHRYAPLCNALCSVLCSALCYAVRYAVRYAVHSLSFKHDAQPVLDAQMVRSAVARCGGERVWLGAPLTARRTRCHCTLVRVCRPCTLADAEPMHSRPGHANARRSRARVRPWESVARCDGGAWCTARRTSGSAFTSVSAARAHSPMPSRCTRDLDVPRRDHCVCARRVVQNQASAPI
jgi:hypothetical protein